MDYYFLCCSSHNSTLHEEDLYLMSWRNKWSFNTVTAVVVFDSDVMGGDDDQFPSVLKNLTWYSAFSFFSGR